jgi:aminoglycoside/choline kinase family phosphotransferase
VAPIEWASAARRADFENWLGPLLPQWGLQPASLAPASADASFRRYFRIQGAACSWIIMDAPPPLEDVRPFVDVAARLLAAGLHAPRVHACDAERGFLLLDDLGTESYLDAFARRPADAGALMGGALAALVRLQSQVDPRGLPPFDEALLVRELELFPDWCVGREFGIEWSALERAAWSAVCRALLDSALAQATVPVHRDWMPRNLMVGQPDPGVLDFQDAVVGPLTYDIACLLRDAFVSWEEPQEIDWAVRWWQAARAAGLPVGDAEMTCATAAVSLLAHRARAGTRSARGHCSSGPARRRPSSAPAGSPAAACSSAGWCRPGRCSPPARRSAAARPVQRPFQPGRQLGRIPAGGAQRAGAAVGVEGDLGVVGRVVLQQPLELEAGWPVAVHQRRQPQAELERGVGRSTLPAFCRAPGSHRRR